MKIGIITITHGTNYGNRLQVYAVQCVLKKLGHDAELIENNTRSHGMLYQFKKRLKVFVGYKHEREEYKREKSYRAFDAKYISIGKQGFNENYMLSDLGEQYDAFLCGSDQVWNPFYPFLNGGCFGDFPKVKKRIAYAASFGEPSIPVNQQEQYKVWLNGMDAISVREESGEKIVKDLTGRKAEVLIDPTMMLDASEWKKIEEAPGNVKKGGYIFQYFLGEKKPEVSEFIRRLSLEKELSIMDVLPAVNDDNYLLNPSHFVYLLDHADIVVTDSFHASVFSVLFGKPLRVFDRISNKLNMSSRLDTLMETFGCDWIRNNFSLSYENDPKYDITDKLVSEREKAMDYLQTALSKSGE